MPKTPSNEDLTPQERLAISRRAIVRNMTRDERERREDELEARGLDVNAASTEGLGNWQLLKRGLKSWWYHHPANLAIDIAKPIVGGYARAHPYKLLAIAAAAGAASVVLKPWRLISMGGLALAAFKSADLTNIAMSMLAQSSQQQSQYSTESNQNE